jgi:hypothetical protein
MADEIDRRISPETRALAQVCGVTKIEISQRRWSAVTRAIESQELALEGKPELLLERLRNGHATHAEQRLIADLYDGRVKPRRKKVDELLAADRRQLVVAFILQRERENPEVKRESFVAEAMKHFNIARSEVWNSLDEYGP